MVLHACCHNPTGADLTNDQWMSVIEIVKTRGLVPILDIAYQGFAEGLAQDGAIVKRFADAMSPVFICSSFSKSFSLYGERIGALNVVTASKDEAARVMSQIKRLVRTNYSNPPTHGCQVVTKVLDHTGTAHDVGTGVGANARAHQTHAQSPSRQGASQKARLRHCIRATATRHVLYSGLSKDIVGKLKSQYSIYAVDSGRICVAALNSQNVEKVAEAIAALV